MTPKNEQDHSILKEIENGTFREYYLIYNRKSTDELENQKNSIKYQKTENTKFALRQHLQVANISLEGFCSNGVISEKHSAFKEDTDLILGDNGLVQYRIERPKFYKLIQLLNKGYFKGVVVLCWDRISRNKGDETVIRKLMKSGIDFRFVLATYDKTSSGALHMDIDGMFAEHHSRVTSEKVSLNIRNQRAKGICTYKAPVGYLNLGKMDDKPFDPERAHLIKRFFELYATGDWTLADLAKWAIEQGFTMPPVRRRRTLEEKLSEEEDDLQTQIVPIKRLPTYTGIHKILTNPFYTGKILGNDGCYVVSHSHQALISEDLFNKVQIALLKKKISIHYTENLVQPLRGMIRCGNCSRLYTPYEKKGIIYFGARCSPGCNNRQKSFNINFITTKIGEYIHTLSFTEAELSEINTRANTDIAVLEMNRLNEIERYDRQKKKIREDLAYLRTNKLSLLKTGVYAPESYIEEEDNLTVQLTKLQEIESISDESMHETIKEVMKLSELLKTVSLQYDFANWYEKEDIIKLIFSELSFSENELKYKCKDGFKPLESRLVLLCDPTTWLSDTHSYQDSLKQSIEVLHKYYNTHPPP
ncbi:MAG: recombinase family protein [Bacteroidetes bacterium]|nr:recombinase family protein [Bacteroidota bacterium]